RSIPVRLNDRIVASLPVPERGQKIHADDLVTGFGVRIGPSGKKAFVLTIGHERRRITLGHYDPPRFTLGMAREKAREILAKRQLGLDQEPVRLPLLKEIAKDYLAERDESVRYNTRKKDGR